MEIEIDYFSNLNFSAIYNNFIKQDDNANFVQICDSINVNKIFIFLKLNMFGREITLNKISIVQEYRNFLPKFYPSICLYEIWIYKYYKMSEET